MSIKSNLIELLGEDKAKEVLSQSAKEMRAKVKNPHVFTSDTAKKAAQKRWQNYEKNKNTPPVG